MDCYLYSPILSKSFNASVNVEFCHSVKAVKYMMQVVNKGINIAMFGFMNINEVKRILNVILALMKLYGEYFWFRHS